MNNKIIEARILDDPGNGFHSRDLIFTVAGRLMQHTKGKIIGGYGTSPDGTVVPLEDEYGCGNLRQVDALYAVEYALTRGLNPYGHIHLWYQRSKKNPQLIIEIDWKILKGWAEWRQPFSTKFAMMEEEDRAKYGLVPGDLGALAYNILDSDSHFFHKYQLTFIESGILFSEAQSMATAATAKSIGVGIVRKGEMVKNGKPIYPPKGRSWQWRAEIRALRDATRRSHGDPPPMQIRAYANDEGMAINENQVALLGAESYPADASPEAQAHYLRLGAQAISIKAGNGNLSAKEQELANDLMRGRNGDDDPLALSEEPEIVEASHIGKIANDSHTEETEENTPPSPPSPPSPPLTTQPPDLLKIRDTIEAEAAANPRQGLATDKQKGLICSKLEEVFADDDAKQKRQAVLSWLCQIDSAKQLKFGQAQAVLKRLICAKDPETGDYPINKKFCQTVLAIFRQTQVEDGQLQLF